jgi:hypothetical protein
MSSFPAVARWLWAAAALHGTFGNRIVLGIATVVTSVLPDGSQT